MGAPMNKYLLSSCVFITLPFASVAASAADTKGPVYEAPAAMSEFDWSGFYAGMNGGYGWGRNAITDLVANNAPSNLPWSPGISPNSDSLSPKGAVFGGHLGYNFEVGGDLIVGVEAGLDWTDLGETKPSIFRPTRDTWSTKITSLLTVDARIGYAVGAWLPYIKIGYAGGHYEDEFVSNLNPVTDTISRTGWLNGWNIGAGFDYAVAAHWVAGIEYNYIDLGTSEWSGVTVGNSFTSSFRDDLRISTVTARFSYKF